MPRQAGRCRCQWVGSCRRCTGRPAGGRREGGSCRRCAPRGILTAVLLSGAIGAIFLLTIILSTKDIAAEIAAAGDPAVLANPIADAIHSNLGDLWGNIYLAVVLTAIAVCLMAIQGATARLMFSMGRDRRLPMSGTWAHVSHRFKTPANAVVAVGVLAAVPFLITDSIGVLAIGALAIGATGTIYLIYFLCNVGVLLARRKGWPHKPAWFQLKSWGLIVNVVAVLYDAVMLVNFGLWHSDMFGDWGNALRDASNPTMNILTFLGSDPLTGLPAWPLFEVTIGLIFIAGAIWYVIAERGKIDKETIEADAATGEAIIR